VLFLKSNRLATKEAGKILAQALAGNRALTELDLSSNNWMEYGDSGAWMGDGPGFAQELAVGIRGNRAMTKFDISSSDIRAEGGKALAAGLKGNKVIKELNINSNSLGENSEYAADTSGFIAIVDVIPGMGAMTSLGLASNYLEAEGAKIVAERGHQGN
jgi:hypothetical protein